jgi:CTP:molybdopterin cytidylyltransferase MocA
LGHEAERVAAALHLPAVARTIVNGDYEAGQSTSLRAGLTAAASESEAAVVLLGDQPSLEPQAIDKVIEAFGAGGRPIARAIWQGTPGHPVVFARSVWPELTELTGDRGARELLVGRGDVTEVEMGAPPVPDVDTWEGYERLKKTL